LVYLVCINRFRFIASVCMLRKRVAYIAFVDFFLLALFVCVIVAWCSVHPASFGALNYIDRPWGPVTEIAVFLQGPLTARALRKQLLPNR
jgi:hypothetical protein